MNNKNVIFVGFVYEFKYSEGIWGINYPDAEAKDVSLKKF
jgi:hypothetical protein